MSESKETAYLGIVTPDDIATPDDAEIDALEAGRFYRPWGAAVDVFDSKEKELLIEGPAGTGKTVCLLEKANIAALKYHGCRILLTRKTRKSLNETVLETFESRVLTEDSLIKKGRDRSYRERYEYPTGSAIVLGGLDKNNVNRLMSSEYDMILAFEATEFTEDDWETLLTRLRHHVMPYQQAIADCNPGAPTHWLNLRASTDLMERHLSRHQDNPLWWDREAEDWTEYGVEYVENTLGRLTGHRRARLLSGRWAATEGLVFPEYDAAVHLIEPFPIPSSWRRFRAIDFGFTNPFVCQWWAMDGDGRLFLYREIYHTQKLVMDLGPKIVRLSEGETIEFTVADHDAEDAATLDHLGVLTTPADKVDIPNRLQVVADRLRDAGDGHPRLFVLHDAVVDVDQSLVTAKKPTCTEQEWDAYVYPEGQDGKADKEVPIKNFDHGMDAMQYLVRAIDGRGAGPAEMSVHDPPMNLRSQRTDASNRVRTNRPDEPSKGLFR